MTHYMRAEKKQFVKNVSDFIIRPLLRQRETGELCDITIHLHDENFHAHRAILALWSPYFLSMFTCDMRERYTGIVDLSEALSLENTKCFSSILDYMYTGSLVITIENVEDMLRISDFLMLDDVKDYCKQFYLDLGNLDLSNCLRVRFLAENHNLQDVTKYCQRIIESRFHDYLIFHDDILDLPPAYLFRLIEDPKVIQHSSHTDLKKLVQRWVEYEHCSRNQYYEDLSTCINLWGHSNDYLNQASYLGRHYISHTNIIMQPACRMDHSGNFTAMSFDPSPRLSKSESALAGEFMHPVLFSVVCNQGLKFIKILVYDITEQRWYNFPVSSDKILHSIPSRQTVCNVVTHENSLYMYLCSSFPYPTDMLKINILHLDLTTRLLNLISFRTVDFYNPCYRTTLTNYRTVPPSMVHCNNNIYIVGNKEGTGHLFLCNLSNFQYTCFQIPGSRFISLARAISRDDRHIFIWFRHRTGPSEEFCIKKSVGFAIFDARTKIFNSWEIQPPDISYDDFAKPYILCVKDDTIFIHYPGKPALVLDEVRCKWVTSLRKTPSPDPDFFIDGIDQPYGYQLQAAAENSIFILNNESPYTTSMFEINESLPRAMSHMPPPIDHILMIASGYLSQDILMSLDRFDRYDEAYASALHVTMRFSDCDTEESGTSNSDEQDSDNDYEYDEDIYDYEYDFDFGFGF